MEMIEKIRFGKISEILELLQGLNFELIENINNYRTYKATNNMGEFEIFMLPKYGASLSYNNRYYRDITEIVDEIM